MTALVSIGVPVYNGERYLAQALASLVAQSHERLEIVVADNASTDGTEEICRDFAARDPRVHYHRHPRNLGASANYNFVFRRSTGAYFRWAAHDDLCAPRLVERCVAALEAGGPELVLAYAQTRLIDEQGRTLRDYDDPFVRAGASTEPSERLRQLLLVDEALSLLYLCFPVFGVIRSDALAHTRLIRNQPRSDVVLLVELALRGRFAELPEYDFLRRTHAASSVETAAASADPMELERRLAAWYDPARGRRYPMTQTRFAIGFVDAWLRAPLAPRERAACLAVLARWFARNFRVIGGDLKLGVRDWIRVR